MIIVLLVLNTDIVKAEINAPKLNGHHAFIAIDARTGQVLMSDNADKRVYPASTTKLMTAVVVLEKVDMKKTIKVTSKMLKQVPQGCSNYGIKKGETYKVSTLLNMLLICSAGDAGICLAVGSFGSVNKCVEAMNDKCKMLGLSDTNFDNPVGVDIGNGYNSIYTTANDMAKITRYAMGREEIKKIVKRKSLTVYQASGKKGRKITSTNKFYYDQEYSEDLYTIIGSKSGTTNAAGYVFIATAIDNEGREIICVYMGKESRNATFGDIRKILDKVYKTRNDGKIELSIGKSKLKTDFKDITIEYDVDKTININTKIVDQDTKYEYSGIDEIIKYSSSNKDVVEVDKAGNIKVKGIGNATIKIKSLKTTYHDEQIKEISVTVIE